MGLLPDAKPCASGEAIGEAHRRYTRLINFREKWKGHLWQGRFASFPMNGNYLLAAARYIEMNPVRARIVKRADQYKWSSAHAHVSGKDDGLVKVEPLLEMAGNWQDFLDSALSDQELEALRRHERTGRPLGNEKFVTKLEKKLERTLKRIKPGPKPRREEKGR